MANDHSPVLAPDTAKADLNAILLFAAVVEAGSFTVAAERLGMTKGRVSADLARLEGQLGVSLLVRTTRKLALTQAGHTLYGQYVPLLRTVREGLPVLGEVGGVSGSLCVGGSVEAMMRAIAPAAASFAERHPQLDIELRATDVMPDLIHEGIDVFIRGGWLSDASMRVAKLGEFEQWVVAAPRYLASAPPIREPQDLTVHEWIAFTALPTPYQWLFTSADGKPCLVKTRGRIRINSVPGLRTLLCRGGGISALDHATASSAVLAGELLRVLGDWSLPRGGVYAVYPPGRYVPPAARAFVEFFRTHLAIADGDGEHRHNPFPAEPGDP